MRLWTLHPSLLDARGLVALWREALLAQAVLAGRTVGYRHHPQLARFRSAERPRAAIAAYLHAVKSEADRRGYRFDGTRIARVRIRADEVAPIAATRGQLAHEWDHLKAKLAARDPDWLAGLGAARRPRCHPLFVLVPGGREPWERSPPAKERSGSSAPRTRRGV